MKLTESQEKRLLELEDKPNLSEAEEIELQGLLDTQYDTGDFEEKIQNNH